MICSDGNSYYVFDEEDTEESVYLRQVSGGHREEISIMRYSDYHSLVATGSVDGEVCVWDFEMSKLEGICIGHTGDITGIEFVVPYPLMLTSSMDGTLCIWGLRPLSMHHKYVCL